MKKPLIILLLLANLIVSAQRYQVKSGDIKNLKGISEYNVTFDYTGLEVNGYESEAAFLKDKIEKRKQYDEGKDIKGKAEQFEKDWYEDRQNKYEPAFIDYFNKRFDKGEIKAGKNPAAKYTMNIKTTWVYPGYEVANVEPAKISAIITVFETNNPSNVLVVLEFDKAIGVVKDYRKQGDRIAGAYERLAKNLSIQLKKFL